MNMKYTVYLMTPYCTWEGIEAGCEEEACDKVSIPPFFDFNEPHKLYAIEEEE